MEWLGLAWQAWVTLGVVAFVLGMLVFTDVAADVVLVCGVVALLLSGVLSSREAFAGMSNEGMLTVAVMYVIVSGLDGTGATAIIAQRLLGRPRSTSDALIRLMTPVAGVSGFLNNTPVVAMFMPTVKDWARQNEISVSKLMMPLSYAAVLGGCCTLIGTSTNLIVNGLLIEAQAKSGAPAVGMGFFDVTWVGVPCALTGIVFILLTQRWLLPNRVPALSQFSDPRQYTIECIVDPAGPLVGKTIEAAGLRHLPQLFLMEIDREGQVLPAVASTDILKASDRLVFVGVVDSVVDLQKIRGLLPATDQVFKLESPRSQRVLIEAVVSDRCPMVGQTIRDGRFRTHYNAAVVAVSRAGERINRKVGDIVLQAGDTLLLEAHPNFAEQQRNSRHFYLVSKVENSNPPRHEKAYVALAILAVLIVVASFEWMSMLNAALVAAGAMIVTRCCTSAQARRGVDWKTLIAIAASFALGRALETTGLAQKFSDALVGFAAGQPWLTLVMIYAVALILTEAVTNNAAAVLTFPIAWSTAANLGVDPTPYVMAVTLAASLGFATPMGYQTHLMVFGPGGYKFIDFVRLGVPIDILCMIIACAVIPWVFPFHP